MNCRHCAAPLLLSLADLGTAPPSNAYVSSERLAAPELWFPLRVLVCERCWLVQTEDFARADELFDHDYAYFSSCSTSWVAHAERYVAAMVERLGLGCDSHVVEIASNDGYLLQHVQRRGIPCTGIEPTASTAAAARRRGLHVVEEFFGADLARRLAADGQAADLITANNVLAHVPGINDFAAGFTALLKPHGVVTFEFPHLLSLVTDTLFDTIYHEHFSYLSLTAAARILGAAGLSIFDVEELPTHGGSLRVFAQRTDAGRQPRTARVTALLAREAAAGVEGAAFYDGFQIRAERIKNDFVAFLLDARRQNQRVAGYGAAAKGNTLMNFGGIKADLLPFIADRSPLKRGRYTPGGRIPIVGEEELQAARPDFVVLFPWNIKQELTEQLAYVKTWGGRFVTVSPALEIA